MPRGATHDWLQVKPARCLGHSFPSRVGVHAGFNDAFRRIASPVYDTINKLFQASKRCRSYHTHIRLQQPLRQSLLTIRGGSNSHHVLVS